MNWYDKLTQVGGSLGAISAYFLNINITHVFEIAFYAFVGASVGEGVKEGVKWYKKKKGLTDNEKQ